MEKHLLPLITALAGIVGQPMHDDDGNVTEVNSVYSLILKIMITGMALGWLVAVGMGGFIIHKFDTITTQQIEFNKFAYTELTRLSVNQANNIKCIDDLKNRVYAK